MSTSVWLTFSRMLFVICITMGPVGCSALPFTRGMLPKLDHPDPAKIIEQQTAGLPVKFTSEDTVSIDTLFKDVAILGYLRMDRQSRTFDLMGMNHVGIQLFLLSVEGDNTQIKSAIGPLQKHPELLHGLANDIRRIYFDLVPNAHFNVNVKPDKVCYAGKLSGTKIKYEFGDAPTVLLTKSQPGLFGPSWVVNYFDYEHRNGQFFAKNIVMDNHQLHYRIVIKNRAW